jgi:hypothetical protein
VAIEQRELDRLIIELRHRGYEIHRLVEHETAERTATVRLLDPSGVLIDLLAARSGIEAEIVSTSTLVPLDPVESIPVAGAEELLAVKILAESPARPQDRLDGLALLRVNPRLDLARVRELLELIIERGYARGEPLHAKLDALLQESGAGPA